MTSEVATQRAGNCGSGDSIKAGDTHRVIEIVTQERAREDNILKCQLVLANVRPTLLNEVRTQADRRWAGIGRRLYVAEVLINS